MSRKHDQLLCSLKQHSVGFRRVITTEWCFPDPISWRRNTGIMDLISSVKILAGYLTRHAKSILHTAPCVFSCQFETKMTPIMPMKSGLTSFLAATSMLVRLRKANAMGKTNPTFQCPSPFSRAQVD